jgi:L-lactate dehydrogenase (cytochrome)
MSNQRLARCISIDDLRVEAKRRLPAPLYDLLTNGREDNVTYERNISDFKNLQIKQKVLRDISKVDTRTKILGCDLSFPLVLSPTGSQSLLDPEGELACARAAAKAGVMYTLSSFSRRTIEEVADSCRGPKMFQLNAFIDDDLNLELLRRAKEANFDAFCLTVDNPVTGKIANFDRWRMTTSKMPPLGTTLAILRKPGWLWRQGTGLVDRSVPHTLRRLQEKGYSIKGKNRSPSWAFRRDWTWEDVAKFRELWDGPFVLKGILDVDDARKAVEIGASAIVVCNHGGSALDGVPSTISIVEEIADAVGNKIEVLLGSGVRRGTSIVKAMALGAKGVLVGRAFLFGLAAAGEEGVSFAIEMLRLEFETSLGLVGCAALDKLEKSVVRR